MAGAFVPPVYPPPPVAILTAILTADMGYRHPWYRYLDILLISSPAVLVLAIVYSCALTAAAAPLLLLWLLLLLLLVLMVRLLLLLLRMFQVQTQALRY